MGNEEITPNQHPERSIYKFSKIKGDTMMDEIKNSLSKEPEGLSKAASC
jgi:hypothetical protein